MTPEGPAQGCLPLKHLCLPTPLHLHCTPWLPVDQDMPLLASVHCLPGPLLQSDQTGHPESPTVAPLLAAALTPLHLTGLPTWLHPGGQSLYLALPPCCRPLRTGTGPRTHKTEDQTVSASPPRSTGPPPPGPLGLLCLQESLLDEPWAPPSSAVLRRQQQRQHTGPQDSAH